MEAGAFHYGARRVFDDISFRLDDARTALVGENGAGKSTLLKCLTGELELNRGKVIRSRGLKVGCLPQDIPAGLAGRTVRQVLAESLVHGGRAGEDWRIEIMLDEIAMSPQDAGGAFGALSGGWQRLTLIAAAAKLEAPDILILDEPTNHLDVGNINVLERWLVEDIDLPMLIVSHDREFLNHVTDRTLFLRSDGLHGFKAPFAVAREELLRRDLAAATRRRLEDKEIRRLEKVAARYKVWGIKNPKFDKRAKATETRIAHIQSARTEAWSARQRRLELAEGDIEAKVALRLENLTVATPDGRPLLAIDRLAVRAGDKLALLGPNGAGKSTLLAALAAAFDPAQEHYDGRAAVRFNPACRLAFFDQAMSDLPLAESPLDYLQGDPPARGAAAGKRPNVGEGEATRVLAKAGFAYARIREPILLLSPGERARLMFLRMKLDGPNIYLLDEPTSHLDIEGQEDLEAQLEESDVSAIFVSHDRYFTRTAATRFLEIRRGKLVEIEEADAFFDAQ